MEEPWIMFTPFSAAETFLEAGDLAGAAEELSNLRPGLRGALEALQISMQIHWAQAHWSNVDVLCRLIRKEYPGAAFGFIWGAESLHRQERSSEAIEMLKAFQQGMDGDPNFLYALARYHCAVGNLLGASLLMGTASGRDLRLREKAFADPELSKIWPNLHEAWDAMASEVLEA
jgi:hypothetical protein